MTIPGIPCPNCGSHRHDVKDSRPRENTTWRRRVCRQCGESFTTWEFSEAEVPSMTRKPRDGLRVIMAMLQKTLQRAEAELRDE